MTTPDPTTGLEPPATLPDALERAAERWGERGIGLIDNRGRPGELRGFATLHRRAAETAARLQGLGVGEREPLLVCLPTSEEFLDTWFGAVLLGAWPVAIAPPGGLGAADFQLSRIDAVRERIGARRMICRPAVRDEARKHGLEDLAACALSPEELAAATPAPLPSGRARSRAGPGDVAFLQLTSGSTGVPRAVMITHRGAVHNPLAIHAALTESLGASLPSLGGCGVSWLPLHHDMGLVGCVLAGMVGATNLWLSSPRTFLGRPHTWLRNLSDFGTTLAPAPNFGYQTCVEQVDEEKLDGVDLSGWRSAMTGAEMIRPETMAGFAERFASHGFSPRAFMPCYGLAEATLAVTFDTAGEGVRTRRVPEEGTGIPREVTSVGRAVIDTEVAICAPDGAPLPAGVVGEIRARGPGVFAGYHRDPEATAAALVDGWLVTGDLGFLHDGELFVTGRTKDILIVNGQNLMPHELEWLAEEVAGGGGATRAGAFSIVRGDEGERAVVAVEVAETDADALRELDRGIRIRIARVLGIPLADLVFVRRGRLPKTTSGKVQRGELRRRYESGELERA